MARFDSRNEVSRLEDIAEQHVVIWNGVPIVWRKFGMGPPLVLIHGGFGSWLHWVRNIELLSWKHTVWVPDLPSMGDSGTIEESDDAMTAIQNIVAALTDSLGQLINRDTAIDIAGFSFGGVVATLFAKQWSNVKRLALVGTGGHGQGRRQTKAMMSWREIEGNEEQQAALRHNLLSLMFRHRESLDSMAVEIYEEQCRKCRFRGRFSRANMLQKMLESFAKPVLFLWGDCDVTVEDPCKTATWLSQGKNEREWRVIPGGHWIQYEDADTVTQLMLRWFNTCTTRGRRMTHGDRFAPYQRPSWFHGRDALALSELS